MKLPLAVTVLATAGVMLAGAQTAKAGMLTSTVEGPNGAVWSGQCPGTIAEKDVDTLSETCRNLGYRMDTASYRQIASLGGTKLTQTASDGTVVNVNEILPGGRWQRTNFLPDGSAVVTACAIAGDAVPYSGCTRTRVAAGGSLAAASATKHAKRHAKRR